MALELKDYKVLSVLGTGSYGTCYKVLKCKTNEIFAWKAIDYGQIPDEKKQLIVSEVNLLSQLCHPNIVQYYGRILSKETTTLYILMECCDGGDLATLIKKCKKDNNFLGEGFVWRVLYQTGRALHACHSHLSNKTVLHRDIKPANVFLDVEGNVKLGDFGLARILDTGGSLAQSVVGTPYYMSPEIIKEEKYNHKSDIWSLGCLVYEMCSLTPPFTGSDQNKLVACIKAGKFNRIPNYYSGDLQDIISYLLTVKQVARPSIDMILHHPTVVTNLVNSTFESQIIKSKEKVRPTAHRDSDANSSKSKVSGTNFKISQRKELESTEDAWHTRFESLKQRESSLREKVLAIEERERLLEKREKEVSLLDRIVKEKMSRANVYLHQCRDSRSTTSGGKNSTRRYSLMEPTLSNIDSSFSADTGDVADPPTSAKLKPACVLKPPIFSSRLEHERRVYFQTDGHMTRKPLVTVQPSIGHIDEAIGHKIRKPQPSIGHIDEALGHKTRKPLVTVQPSIGHIDEAIGHKTRKPLVTAQPSIGHVDEAIGHKIRKPQPSIGHIDEALGHKTRKPQPSIGHIDEPLGHKTRKPLVTVQPSIGHIDEAIGHKTRKPLVTAQPSIGHVDEAVKQNFHNDKKEAGHASYAQDRSIWLENKRQAYKAPLVFPPHRLANKENDGNTTKKKPVKPNLQPASNVFGKPGSSGLDHFR